MEEKNIFTGKTVEEATEAGLAALNIQREQAEITVIDEGKRKLIGSVKAKVSVVKKETDGERAQKFLDGLLQILGFNAVTEIVSDEEKVVINLTSTESSRIIGHHGEVLDSMQTLAGAVANIGRTEYKKVVVDCENYRDGRETTLKALAQKIAKKAVEKQRRVSLEPMNPYERRIIHSALADSEEVKTISCGNEPNRYVVVIPNNEKPYERRDRGYRDGGRGGRTFNRDRESRGGRREFNRDKRGFRDDRRGGGRPQNGGTKAKKEIHFGTFLGNNSSTENKE